MMSSAASTASVTGSVPRRLSSSLSVPAPAISMVMTGAPSISSLPTSAMPHSSVSKTRKRWRALRFSEIGRWPVFGSPLALALARSRLEEAGIEADPQDKRLGELLRHVKEREDQGFAYDSAQASFELLARRYLGQLPKFFEVDRYRVSVERRDEPEGIVTVSEAVVVVHVDGERMISASESIDPVTHADQGPVNALARALRKDLGRYQEFIDDLKLVDFKVRIIGAGTEAVTRVLIDSADSHGNTWSTVGVSPNIVDASFQALEDAVFTKLILSGAPAAR